MKNIENFLNYIIENIDDERILLQKKVKYGYRYFTLSINLPTKNSRDITIIIDCRNNVIEVGYDFGMNVVIESEQLVQKWSDILESRYSKSINTKFENILADFILQTESQGKDFWRDWTMKKIFKTRNKKI